MKAPYPVLAVIALFILAPAAVAMARRNLVHGALLLVASWAGVAAFYLWSGAEFVAFAQVLVYVGAVSMIVLFAVLLTGRSRVEVAGAPVSRGRTAWASLVGLAVALVIAGAGLATPLTAAGRSSLPVRRLGRLLAGPDAAALLVAGAILTVALLGALVLAATSRRGGGKEAA